MKKILFIFVLSLNSIQGYASSCPDGSEPVKSISSDGSYYVFNCEEKNSINTQNEPNVSTQKNDRIPGRADYTKSWNFNYNKFSLFNVDKYAARHYELWNDSYESKRLREFHNYYVMNNCDQVLKDDINVFTGWVDNDKYSPLKNCVMDLGHIVRMEVVRQGKGKYTTKFFEELIPYWLENDAFVFNRPRFEHRYQEEVNYDNLRYNIFYNYYTLANWYGADEQRDKQMLEWWEMQERKQTHAIWSRNADKCWAPYQTIDGSSFYPQDRMDQGTGLCGNAAAMYAGMLQLTGLYHKNNDYINESLWVVENILSGADKDGATHDAIRGGKAPSYLMKTSMLLDAMAVNFEYYFDFDMYEVANSEGTSVKDVVLYGFNAWHYPESNHHYAVRDPNARRGIYDLQGQEACRNPVTEDDRQECMSQIAGYSDQITGKYTRNTPEYKKYFRSGSVQVIQGWRQPIIHEVR